MVYDIAKATPSPRSSVPLLSLTRPAVTLGDSLNIGECEDSVHVGGIWNVITRAADLVKDGDRLENLAWRHWSLPQQQPRRLSVSSAGTCSSASLETPLHEHAPFLNRKPSFEKRTFGGSLKLLVEEDHFIDWVTDAKKNLPLPVITVPDTPVPNLEIRLVEPTPVPSRVGSLGGSISTGGLLSAAVVPPMLHEEVEEEEEESAEDKPLTLQIGNKSRSPGRRRGKFFVQSSPTKGGSGSESSQPSPISPAKPNLEVPSSPQIPPQNQPPLQPRRSSGSSSGAGVKRKEKEKDRDKRRHVSLSTMRGKFTQEKRKAAQALSEAAQAANEESGWEDDAEEEAEDEEGWSDEPEEKPKRPKPRSTSQPQAPTQAPPPAPPQVQSRSQPPPSPKQTQGETKPANRPTLRHRSSSKSGNSSSNLDLLDLLTRQNPRKTSNKQVPPPPAPTPLRKMSKKERQAAAAERAKIEAELDAQRKREMFAKQQIFGTKSGGLLTGMLQRGGSMVDLTQKDSGVKIRPSPTHGHLPSLNQTTSHSPVGPALLRSKSAVAIPVQTGVSVTVRSQMPQLSSNEPEPISKSKSMNQSTSANGPSNQSVKSNKSNKSQGSGRRPSDVDMETSDEESEDDYLATSETQRKLEALAAKREAKAQPVPNHVGRLAENGIVVPNSPTTQRRQMIMREMSESLRKNLILERQKSSAPITRNISFGQRPIITSRGSSTSLHQPAPVSPVPEYDRRKSDQDDYGHSPSRHAQQQLPRNRSTVLGGGFLRPLTRVGHTSPLETQPPNLLSNDQQDDVSPTYNGLNRTQSSANLSTQNQRASPILEPSQAPAMMRSSTEGAALHEQQLLVERRKLLAKRSETTDTSYRMHGW